MLLRVQKQCLTSKTRVSQWDEGVDEQIYAKISCTTAKAIFNAENVIFLRPKQQLSHVALSHLGFQEQKS